jgi:hypothetical protein
VEWWSNVTRGTGDKFATFELEPLDPRSYRSAQAEEIWETARRKANRIAIGRPRWRLETSPSRDGLLLASDLRDQSTETSTFWVLGLDLTLLPDEGCRFRSAQLSVAFVGSDEPPHVLRLRPGEIAEQQLAVGERSGMLQASLKAPLGIGTEIGISRGGREEVTQTLVRLASFGAGTQEAGWRLRMTNAREIPLNSTDLEALVVSPTSFEGQVVYSVIAEIEVRSALDRWLTAVFKPRDAQRLRSAEPFPPRA